MPSITAQSSIDICNQAVGNLGISVQIQSIEPPDQTAQANACAFWYPKVRDTCLQSAPWNFADTNEILVQEVANSNSEIVAMPGYAYSYTYPNDVLQPIAVTTIAGQRSGSYIWSNWWNPYIGVTIDIPKIPFKLVESQATPGELAIVCDILATSACPVYLFYIQSVTNTAMYDPLFIDYFGWALAARVGGSLKVDQQRIQYCDQMAGRARLNALAQHLNAAQQDRERQSPSTLARR
jgi:hypothetical protein